MTTKELKSRFALRHWASVVAAIGVLAFGASAQADVLIKNVTLYDGTGAPAVKGANVLVKGERIAAVSTKPISPGRAKVIDGTGKYLMPGIWDTHIHLVGGQAGDVNSPERKPVNDRQTGLKALSSFLYSGVTSVYDSGNNPEFIFPLRADERAGKIVSPRIFAAGGVISVPGGYGAGATAMKATTWEATKPLLDAKFANEKPDMIKLILEQQGLYANKAVPIFSDDLFRHIVEYAKQNGYRSTVHVSSEWNADTAARLGVTAMAHPVTRAVLNESFVKMLADKKIPISTTMSTSVGMVAAMDDPAFYDGRLFKATMTEAERNDAKGPDLQRYIASGRGAQVKVQKPYVLGNIKRLHDSGVILASGTDRSLGAYSQAELTFLNLAGISPFDIIKMATLNGAIYVGREKDLGSIEIGKYADLLLLDADPAADVKNFQAINTVIKNGQRIDLATLDVPANRHTP